LYVSDQAAYQKLVLKGISGMDSNNLLHAFQSPRSNSTSHYVLITEPTSDRGAFRKRVASRRVFELLWKKRLAHLTFDMGYFYHWFRASPITAASAGLVFEFRMRQLLMEQRTIQVFPIIQSTPEPANYVYEHYPGKNPVDLQMARTEKHRSVANHRYYLRSTAIDPLFLIYPPDDLPPILLVFEATQNAEDRDAGEDGFRRVDGSTLDPNLHRYYVVVALENTRPRVTVPKEYHEVTGINRPLPEEVLRVFNYPVPRGVLFPERSN
jgi:hypothetical protein